MATGWLEPPLRGRSSIAPADSTPGRERTRAEYLIEELGLLGGVGELFLVDLDVHGEDVVLIEAGVDGLELRRGCGS